MRDNWPDVIALRDPRIKDSDARVRAAAELIHFNDSIHRHHDLDANVCVYCALVASRAVEAIDGLAGNTEVCWSCHEPLDPETAVTRENPWPLSGAHRYCPDCDPLKGRT